MHQVSPQQSQEKSQASEPTKAQAPEQAPAQEVKAEPEKLSPQFAALARKEKALRLEARRIKLEREEVKAEKDKFKTQDYIPKDRLTKETLQVLAEAGLSQDQIAQLLLNNPTPIAPKDPTISKLEAQVAELMDKLSKTETDFKDNQTKAYDQAVNQIRNDVKLMIDSDPSYETIKARNLQESVVKHIERTFHEDGVMLTNEQAAQEVEEALREETKRLTSLSYMKPEPVPQAPKQETQMKQQPVRTLTHDMVSSSNKQSLNQKQRIERAKLLYRGIDPDTGKPIAG